MQGKVGIHVLRFFFYLISLVVIVFVIILPPFLISDAISTKKKKKLVLKYKKGKNLKALMKQTFYLNYSSIIQKTTYWKFKDTLETKMN